MMATQWRLDDKGGVWKAELTNVLMRPAAPVTGQRVLAVVRSCEFDAAIYKKAHTQLLGRVKIQHRFTWDKLKGGIG